MKKKFALILAVVLLAFNIAACGGKPVPAEEPAVEEAAPTEEPAVEEASPTEEPVVEEAAMEEPAVEEAAPEEEPAVETEPVPTPSREDLRGHGKIAVPKDESWLPAYETRYVCSVGGVAAFLYKAPMTGADQLDNVIEGTQLTLLARENEFYLVKTEDGRVGWVGEIQTAEDTHLLDSVPSFDGTYWIYHKGTGDEKSYACLFSANRRAAGARISDGKRFASDWTLSMRRVKFDGLYFAWNGEEFVSRDEFDTPEGKIRYTIVPDAEQLYDQLAG